VGAIVRMRVQTHTRANNCEACFDARLLPEKLNMVQHCLQSARASKQINRILWSTHLHAPYPSPPYHCFDTVLKQERNLALLAVLTHSGAYRIDAVREQVDQSRGIPRCNDSRLLLPAAVISDRDLEIGH